MGRPTKNGRANWVLGCWSPPVGHGHLQRNGWRSNPRRVKGAGLRSALGRPTRSGGSFGVATEANTTCAGRLSPPSRVKAGQGGLDGAPHVLARRVSNDAEVERAQARCREVHAPHAGHHALCLTRCHPGTTRRSQHKPPPPDDSRQLVGLAQKARKRAARTRSQAPPPR